MTFLRVPYSVSNAVFWISAVCIAIAQIGIVRSVFRANRDAASALPGVPRPRRGAEVAWTILPGGALAALLVATWLALNSARVVPETAPDSHPHAPGADSLLPRPEAGS